MDSIQPTPNSSNNPAQKRSMFFAPEHMVGFYTLLAVLLKMKKDLGLEAMLEYMACYLKVIGSHNPKLVKAVSQTLEIIPVEVIYHELGDSGKNS